MPVMVVGKVRPRFHGLIVELVLFVMETLPVYPEDQTLGVVKVTFTPVAAESDVARNRHATATANTSCGCFLDSFIVDTPDILLGLTLAVGVHPQVQKSGPVGYPECRVSAWFARLPF
jgi:hypothetical protein